MPALVVSDILSNIEVQSKGLSNRIVGAVLKLETTIQGSSYDVVETVELVIDNFVFVYEISLSFTVSATVTVSASSATLIQSQTIPLGLSASPYPANTSQIPSIYVT